MPRPLKIDFVSDVVCPWCVIGLGALNQALERLSGEVEATMRFQPFELNAQMRPEGENVVEYLGRKTGASPEQMVETRAMIRVRAAEVGFAMRTTDQSRTWNTFDAHRLIHWAGELGLQEQGRMKAALFTAHFTEQRPLSDPETLAGAAEAAGLDAVEARAILASDRYADAVRVEEAVWRQRGITSVPSIVINDKYLINGGQPVDVFEETLRRIAGEETIDA